MIQTNSHPRMAAPIPRDPGTGSRVNRGCWARLGEKVGLTELGVYWEPDLKAVLPPLE